MAVVTLTALVGLSALGRLRQGAQGRCHPLPLPAGTTAASFPKGATLVRAGKKIALVKAGTVIKAGDPITPRLCA